MGNAVILNEFIQKCKNCDMIDLTIENNKDFLIQLLNGHNTDKSRLN
jgi:hypothetical protein